MPFYPGRDWAALHPDRSVLSHVEGARIRPHTRFIELAGEINTAMPDHVVRVAVEALNDDAKAVKGSRVLILGLAYKANVDDDRESPSYKLIERFEALGATVAYHDPFVPVIRTPRARRICRAQIRARHHPDYDLIVLSTGHEFYRDFDFSKYPMPLVDTRNCVGKKPQSTTRLEPSRASLHSDPALSQQRIHRRAGAAFSRRAGLGEKLEIIAVEDGSTDGSWSRIEKLHPECAPFVPPRS